MTERVSTIEEALSAAGKLIADERSAGFARQAIGSGFECEYAIKVHFMENGGGIRFTVRACAKGRRHNVVTFVGLK